jgi:hypothetical protein
LKQTIQVNRNLKLWQWIAIALGSGRLLAAEFHPGEVWLDVSGQPIQAHGGGILLRDKTYYWYGEDRTPGTRGAVSCYSSTNLFDWKREGVALSQTNLPRAEFGRSFVERPKVIFNQRTGKYVMWMHLEQGGYRYSRAGIATADKPAGPFTFLTAIRPITNDFGFSSTNDAAREKEFGGTFRDMNVFVDDDGKAYVFYASEGNWTMYVVRLNEDYTGPETPAVENKTFARILVRRMREAPAPFKFKDKYYLITSECTGWRPNQADYAVADHPLGPWESKGNPCVGPDAKITFNSQSTFVLPAPGRPGCFIFMSDRWMPQQLSDSRHIWLPLVLKPDGSFTLTWQDHWDFTAFDSK